MNHINQTRNRSLPRDNWGEYPRMRMHHINSSALPNMNPSRLQMQKKTKKKRKIHRKQKIKRNTQTNQKEKKKMQRK